METFFDIISFVILGASLVVNVNMFKKININEEVIENLYKDIESIEKSLVLLSEKVQTFPDIIKADNFRSLQALSEKLDAAKPIKPNNWDSVKEAFKGPVRIEINERN